MTAKEVNAMTDEQLCDCVAKLIDWKPDKLCIDGGESATDCIEGQYKDDDCTVLSDAGSWKTCMYGMPSPRPDWPNDIAAAWELVDELERKGHCIDLFSNGVEGWACEVDDGATVIADSAPRAITKVFIIAMDES